MLRLQCQGCGTSAYVDCECPEGHPKEVVGHHNKCPLDNLGNAVVCPPDSGCCQVDHGGGGHDEAANACPGGHRDCPTPMACPVWEGQRARVGPDDETPDHLAHLNSDSCPGGHCHKDIDGCTVCRPILIEIMPGHGPTLQRALEG